MGATPPPARVIIGLDVGTTGTKAVAFGLSTPPWRHVVVREYPLLEPGQGRQVQEPETIMAAVAGALTECVAACGGAEVVAISVSAAMHGLIGLDGGMRPRTPLVTWADARAAAEARELRASSEGAALHRDSGTPMHPMSPLAKLMWYARHEPDLAATVRWWAGLKDYVLWRLTGTLVTELSSASGTGLLDCSTRAWNPRAVELAGISADQLPEMLPTTATLALSAGMAGRTGVPTGTPVVVGAADGPLGNLGAAAMKPGVVGLSLGTSGAVRMVMPEPPSDLDDTLFCYALTEDAWVVGGAVSTGGIIVRWAEQALAPDLTGDATHSRDTALLELAATAPAGCDGLVMVPYLLPERAPLWDPSLPGAYLGLRRNHTRAHLIRAAIEGVCLQLAIIVDQLHELAPITAVHATGGAFRSPLWQQIMTAALDRPLTVVGDAEGSALGAAALGLYAVGSAVSPTAAVEMLSPADLASNRQTTPDPALVARCRDVRAAIPRLIGSLQAVAGLFAADEARAP